MGDDDTNLHDWLLLTNSAGLLVFTLLVFPQFAWFFTFPCAILAVLGLIVGGIELFEENKASLD